MSDLSPNIESSAVLTNKALAIPHMVKELRELGYLVLAPGEILSGGTGERDSGFADIELSNDGYLAVGAAEEYGGRYKAFQSPISEWSLKDPDA